MQRASRLRLSQSRTIEQGVFEWLITETNEVTVCDNDFTNVAAGGGNPSVGHPQLIGVGGGFLGDVEDEGLNIGQAEFCRALREGGVWVSVPPGLSDMPIIGIADGEMDIRDWTMREYNPRIIWVGHEPVFIERRINRPVLFPPMARYYWGHAANRDLLAITGEANNAALLPQAGAFAYYCTVHYGNRPVRYPPAMGWVYRFRNVYAIVHDNADTANPRQIRLGTLVCPPSYGYISSWGTLTGGPLIANWEVQGRHQDIDTAATLVNVGMNPPTKINFNPRTKFYVDVNIQAAAAADGQIDVDSILEVCTGGFDV